MKKVNFAFAIVLAGVFTSCGDTNYCYELTTKVTILGTTTSAVSYVWGTSNELDAAIAEAKAALEATGVSKDAYSVTYKKANKSAEDCIH